MKKTPPRPANRRAACAAAHACRLARFAISAPGVMYSYHRLDAQHSCLPYVSPAIRALSGLQPGELENDVMPLLRLIHPDDRRRLDQVLEQSARDFVPYRLEFRLHHPESGERWVEMHASPELSGDGSSLWHGFMMDITDSKRAIDLFKENERELRQTRNRLATVLNTLPDLVWLKDSDGVYLTCNPAFERFFGASEAAIVGKTDYDFVDRELADFFRQKDLEAIVANRICVNEETITYADDGRSGTLETRKVPVLGDDGEVIGVLGIGRDVSAIKQAEERLRQSHDTLRTLAAHQKTEHEEERRELAHLIHEDLAQSLSALRMHLSLLEMKGETATPPGQLEDMRGIADQCISRSRALVSMLRPTALDAGIVPALRWLADDFGTGVGLKFELFLQEEVELDDETATFLFRAAREALINIALHAAATQVGLSLRAVDSFCTLVVRDNGCGFNPKAPRCTGTFGLLGLAEQAHHLGGALLVDATPARGTTLEIRVPAKPAAVDRKNTNKNQ